jgi:hypothetical protein
MKSKSSGCRAGSATRSVMSGGAKLQAPIYGKPKLAESRISNSGIKVSRKPDTIGSPRK